MLSISLYLSPFERVKLQALNKHYYDKLVPQMGLRSKLRMCNSYSKVLERIYRSGCGGRTVKYVRLEDS